ncbi:hypothetical protein FRC07_010752, partial [Ceratobasidium sp. 392]
MAESSGIQTNRDPNFDNTHRPAGMNPEEKQQEEIGDSASQLTQMYDLNNETAVSKMITLLVEHGCPDASDSLDLSQCGERPVAFGGFGDIYYGKTKGGVPVAIKCARVNVNEAVAKELHAWSKCKHENVVELIGLTQFRGQLATLSPWMTNRAIPHYLAKHPEANRYELVHGDVKGWNVLVSEDGIAKLTDLGSTKLKDASLQFTSGTSATVLSLRWAAPELLGGLSSYSTEADVYALGMTFLEVMTGEVPYEGQSDLAVCGQVLARRQLPPRPSGNKIAFDFQ